MNLGSLIERDRDKSMIGWKKKIPHCQARVYSKAVPESYKYGPSDSALGIKWSSVLPKREFLEGMHSRLGGSLLQMSVYEGVCMLCLGVFVSMLIYWVLATAMVDLLLGKGFTWWRDRNRWSLRLVHIFWLHFTTFYDVNDGIYSSWAGLTVNPKSRGMNFYDLWKSIFIPRFHIPILSDRLFK